MSLSIIRPTITAGEVTTFGPGWTGGARYTVLLNLAGDVLFKEQGGTDVVKLRRAIPNDTPDDNFIGQHD